MTSIRKQESLFRDCILCLLGTFTAAQAHKWRSNHAVCCRACLYRYDGCVHKARSACDHSEFGVDGTLAQLLRC